jgi:HSP20 family protein
MQGFLKIVRMSAFVLKSYKLCQITSLASILINLEKITLYKKFKTMLAIRRNYPSVNLLDSLFEDLFDFPAIDSGVKTPIHDVIENDKEFQIELLLAGVKKEDISIDIERDVLIIKAERKEIKDIQYNRKQTYFGKYERSFNLPDNVDKDNIDASLVDGILKVIIPKVEIDTKLSKIAIEIK